MLMQKTTAEYFKSENMRPFVMSRSTFSGSGTAGGHFLPEMSSTYRHMFLSVSSIFNFGLFGIPFTGADICGYYGNATETLCKRWTDLGAFYPFARNHNGRDARSQEPYTWNHTTNHAMKNAIMMRYSLVRYFYT